MSSARHPSLEAVQNLLPEFQQKRCNFFWAPIFLSPLGLCDISVQNRFDQQDIHDLGHPPFAYYPFLGVRQSTATK